MSFGAALLTVVGILLAVSGGVAIIISIVLSKRIQKMFAKQEDGILLTREEKLRRNRPRDVLTAIGGSALYFGFLLALFGITYSQLGSSTPSMVAAVVRTLLIIYCISGMVYLLGFYIGHALDLAFPAYDSGNPRSKWAIFFEVVLEFGIIGVIYFMFHGVMRMLTTYTSVSSPSFLGALRNLLSFPKFEKSAGYGWLRHLLTLPKSAVTGFFIISLLHGHTELMNKVRYLTGTTYDVSAIVDAALDDPRIQQRLRDIR